MKIIYTLLIWAFIAGMLAVNALANILPINQLSTGQISALYPNLFVPAGFTFAIWSVIYLLLLGFGLTATLGLLRADRFPGISGYLKDILPWFLLTCLLNACWMLAWHYLLMPLSVFLMLALLGTLIHIYRKGCLLTNLPAGPIRFFLLTPFGVYLGWISVATVANITAWLVKLSWDGLGLDPAIWSGFLQGIAAVLGLFFILRERNFAYPLVICWALWGIRAARLADHPSLATMAVCCEVFLGLGITWEIIRHIRQSSTSVHS